VQFCQNVNNKNKRGKICHNILSLWKKATNFQMSSPHLDSNFSLIAFKKPGWQQVTTMLPSPQVLPLLQSALHHFTLSHHRHHSKDV
jgi:hypothetical protein